jgi:glycosyltransferase involved in cell wall biosynthesis
MVPSLLPLNGYPNVRIISLELGKSLFRFLKNIEKEYRFDLFFITTLLPGMIPLWFFRPAATGAKLVLNIHSANEWFAAPKNLGLKQLLLTLVRWTWKRRADYISVGLAAMKSHLLTQGRCKLPIIVIPFSFFDNAELVGTDARKVISKPNSHRKLRIVIPGVYSSKRRKYLDFLSALENQSNQCMLGIEIEMLGAPKTLDSDVEQGLSILDRARYLAEQGFHLVSHDRFVTRDYFLNAIRSADLIVSPINLYGVVGEEYGVSKDTGVFSDIIESAKPACLPTSTVIPDNLRNAVAGYADMDSLFELILNFKDDYSLLRKYQIAALECANCHSIDSIRRRVFPTLGIRLTST